LIRWRNNILSSKHEDVAQQLDEGDRSRSPVPSVAYPSAESIETRSTPQRRTVLKLVVAAVFCVVLLLWVELCPFQEKTVVQNLEEASDSRLRLRTFYRTYFPFLDACWKGWSLITAQIRASRSSQFEKLIIRGSYFGIFFRRLSSITAEHVHVFIPPFGKRRNLSHDAFENHHR
jgi:hypothetical protein